MIFIVELARKSFDTCEGQCLVEFYFTVQALLTEVYTF